MIQWWPLALIAPCMSDGVYIYCMYTSLCGVQKCGDDDFFLGKHPLASLEGAGCMQLLLRKQFHNLLQTVANKMPHVRYFCGVAVVHGDISPGYNVQ